MNQDNPTGRIQWPSWFAVGFVLLFAILAHVFLTVATHRHPDHTIRLCLSQLVISFTLGCALRSLSRPDASAAPTHKTPHARVVRMPATWATQVAPPGKMLTHCTTCWKPPLDLLADPCECCWCPEVYERPT